MKKNIFKRTLVIGDLHGCYYTLQNLLEKLNYNKKEDRLIFLGDYLDRGKNTKLLVDFLISLQEEVGTEKVVCIKGNHEKMFSDYTKKRKKWLFDNNTQIQLGDNIEHYTDWIDKLPTHIVEDNLIFVHGGVPHGIISDNTESDFIWTYRNDYINKTNKTIICGHAVADGVYEYDDIIGIDTGCCFNIALSALIIKEGQSLQFISIPTDVKDVIFKDTTVNEVM